MKKTCLALLLCALTFSLTAFASNRDYQTGKLVDVNYDDLLHSGSSQRHAIYQVRLDDVIYYAESGKLKARAADPAHGLIVGDHVRVAVEGDRLYLRRADGKDIKATIIKRQRVEHLVPRSWFVEALSLLVK